MPCEYRHGAARWCLTCVRMGVDRGPVSETVKSILGGLRSCCTYIGASQLKEVSRRATFIRVTMQTNEVFQIAASL